MGSDQDALTVPESVCDPQRLAAVRATGLLDTGPDGAVARFGDDPADDDVALLVLRVRDDEVRLEHG